MVKYLIKEKTMNICTKCGGKLYWANGRKDVHAGFKEEYRKERTFFVCGRCLPVDGLPKDWPNRHKLTPVSALLRAEEWTPIK
jgi:hypothetical protein